jgi:LytS/YehU family sensor histidine kinase
VRHLKIEHCNIRAVLFDEPDSLLAIVGLCHHLDSRILLQKTSDAMPYHTVIVRQHDANALCFHTTLPNLMFRLVTV